MLAAGIFVSCNIDNLLMLMFLFCTPMLAVRKVVISQFVSQGLLLVISLILVSAASRLSLRYVDVAGLLPLSIGVLKLRERASRADVDPRAEPDSLRAGASIGGITLLMLSAGGDNLSVYVPLFMASPAAGIVHFCCVFFLMAGVWCALAYSFATHAVLGRAVRRYSARILPWNMIGLGVYVLSGLLRAGR